MVVSLGEQIRFPVEGVPDALLGVDLDVECPFPSGVGSHVSNRVVMGALSSSGIDKSDVKARQVHYLCLNCWTTYIYQPKMGIPTAMRVVTTTEKHTTEADEQEALETRGRLKRNMMAKRMKRQECALCNEPFVRKVDGLKFCEEHAAAYEARESAAG